MFFIKMNFQLTGTQKRLSAGATKVRVDVVGHWYPCKFGLPFIYRHICMTPNMVNKSLPFKISFIDDNTVV